MINDDTKKAALAQGTNTATEADAAASTNERHKGNTFSVNTQELLHFFQPERAEKPLPEDLPIWGLPEAVQRIIETYTDVYQCPRAFVTGAVLVAAGTAAGKFIRCYDGKYYNSPCLWLCNIAPSGSNKSQPVDAILKPLTSYHSSLYDGYRLALLNWKQECKEIRAAAKSKKNVELPAPPIAKQMVLDDTTPEARYMVLSNNQRGVLAYVDELRGMIDNIGRYNSSGELSQMLSIWDGKDITINRKTADENGQYVIIIREPFMPIIGSMQPKILPDTFNAQMCENGYLFRYLFCYPDTADLPEYRRGGVPYETSKAWDSMIRRIIDWGNKAEEDSAHPEKYTLKFDAFAQDVLEQFVNANRERMNACSEDDDFSRSVLAKQDIQVDRLALITAILHGAQSVQDVHVAYAIECVRYFERSMNKVCNKLSGTAPTPKEPTRAEAAALFFRKYPELKTQTSQIARMAGLSEGYFRNALDKEGKKEQQAGTGYGYGNTQTRINTGGDARTQAYPAAAPVENTKVRTQNAGTPVNTGIDASVPRTPYLEGGQINTPEDMRIDADSVAYLDELLNG